MEKLRTATFTAKIWKSSNSFVLTIPPNEIRSGKFKEGQLVQGTIETIGISDG